MLVPFSVANRIILKLDTLLSRFRILLQSLNEEENDTVNKNEMFFSSRLRKYI